MWGPTQQQVKKEELLATSLIREAWHGSGMNWRKTQRACEVLYPLARNQNSDSEIANVISPT